MMRECSEKERKILDAAILLIETRGSSLGSMKVADIAQAAGIGKGTVYEYFSSKVEILQQAICYYIENEVEQAWCEIRNEVDFRSSVLQAMKRMLRAKNCPSIWNPQLLNLLDHDSGQQVLEQVRDYCMEHMTKMSQQLLERGVAEGLFPVPDPKWASLSFINLFCGLDFVAHFEPAEDALNSYLETEYDMLLCLLKNAAPQK